jgi:hypothetical protein
MKINWNWGTKLVLAIIAFMSFMIGMVCLTTLQTFDLVEKDYYPQAQEHQMRMDKIQNARNLTDKIRVENRGDHLRFVFQPAFNPESISGQIRFYRPADKNADFKASIQPDTSGYQEFTTLGLKKGKYIVQFEYEVSGKGYYQEETVIVNHD